MPWSEFCIWFTTPALTVVCWHHAHELMDELTPGMGVNIAGDALDGPRVGKRAFMRTGLTTFFCDRT